MKIKVTVATRFSGSKDETELEIDPYELQGMDGKERAAYIENAARYVMFDMIEWNWREVPA